MLDEELNRTLNTGNFINECYLQIKAYTEGSVTPVEIYYGVPYATPPKGRYRFSVSSFLLPKYRIRVHMKRFPYFR